MKHTAEQGEDLAWIALRYGRRNWKTIWEHDDNATLREKRPNPHVLNQGDEVTIPPLEPKDHEVETGEEHTFVLPTPRAHVRVWLLDSMGIPYAGKRFQLKVGSDEYLGETRPDGLVDQEIAVSANEADLYLLTSEEDEEFEDGIHYHLLLAHLDHHMTITGAQARLENLGYDQGEVDGKVDEVFKKALAAFQMDQGLTQTEVEDDATEIDEETAEALRKVHGS